MDLSGGLGLIAPAAPFRPMGSCRALRPLLRLGPDDQADLYLDRARLRRTARRDPADLRAPSADAPGLWAGILRRSSLFCRDLRAARRAQGPLGAGLAAEHGLRRAARLAGASAHAVELVLACIGPAAAPGTLAHARARPLRIMRPRPQRPRRRSRRRGSAGGALAGGFPLGRLRGLLPFPALLPAGLPAPGALRGAGRAPAEPSSRTADGLDRDRVRRALSGGRMGKPLLPHAPGNARPRAPVPESAL